MSNSAQADDKFLTETVVAAAAAAAATVIDTPTPEGPDSDDFLLPPALSSPPANEVTLPVPSAVVPEEETIDGFPNASYYWDASTMAPLSATSAVST